MTTQSQQTLQNRYYWLGDVLIKEGSIVLPGNWARIVSETPGHTFALREYLYEKVRLEEFANLPSRFTSAFICQGLDNIRLFQQSSDRQRYVTYEVAIVNPNTRRCTLDSELLGIQNVQEGGRLLSANELIAKARTYWQSNKRTDIAIPEVLVESPIKILKRI